MARSLPPARSGLVPWTLALAATLAPVAVGQIDRGDVKAQREFDGTEADAAFGETTLAWLGDLDGNSVGDVAVGAAGTDDGHGGFNQGAVWIVFRRADGSELSRRKIGLTQGGLSGGLDSGANFGRSIAPLGDLDGDGTPELAVGAPDQADEGAIWILSLSPHGQVVDQTVIGEGQGGFDGTLTELANFGHSLAPLGDVDGDGVVDLAAGSPGDEDGADFSTSFVYPFVGAVWILFLNADGTVKATQKISKTAGGFAGPLEDRDWFGFAVAGPGDIDGDGVVDLVVTSNEDYVTATLWFLFLNSDGTVKAQRRVLEEDIALVAEHEYFIGESVTPCGDVDGDGMVDLALGAYHRRPEFVGGSRAVLTLFLRADGSHHGLHVMGPPAYLGLGVGFTPPFGNYDGHNTDYVGRGLGACGDVDGDGVPDLLVGDSESFWIVERSGSQWTDLGNGLAGSSGEPLLEARGALVETEPWCLELSQVLPNAPTVLVIGTSEASLPFFGGTLVPSPDLVRPWIVNGFGKARLVLPWKNDYAAGLTFWLQAWAADPGAPGGASASNAWKAEAP